MCGIIGINGSANIIQDTLTGLSRLEYRGYDSAGISYITDNKIITTKVSGKISQLQEKILQTNPYSNIAIAHTRWATHGEPSERNAHPHSSKKVSIVHNGIVENHEILKKELAQEGVVFSSDTDSEVILHLVEKYLNLGCTPAQAVRKTSSRLDGAFAILVLFSEHPNILIATKKHSPLAVGMNKDCTIVSSDSFSVSNLITEISYLEDYDLAIVYKDQIEIFDQKDHLVTREKKEICSKMSSYEKGQFEHYMQKEIFEQPITSKATLDLYLKDKKFTSVIPNLDVAKIEKIYIIACGTSYCAGLVAKHWIQDLLHISVEVEIASEFQYNPFIQNKNNIAIFISQSGETSDTVRCLRAFKNHTLKSIGIVNVPESTIGRESDICLPINAGQEIGVASTKSFTSQLIVLGCLVLKAALEKKSLPEERVKFYVESILLIPGRIADLLNYSDQYQKIAKLIINSKSVIYIGRGMSYAIASEGALKLKELSYIHAEAIPAGELKHGPIALIDEQVSVVAIAPNDSMITKTISNVHSILSRKGNVILLSDFKENGISNKCSAHLSISSFDVFSTPILYTIPLQLFSYYAAIISGNNVDQPRNLAKSVTVE